MNKIKIYIKSILIPVIIGTIVGFIISKFIDYNSLQKPPLAPPCIAFPIIWSIIFFVLKWRLFAFIWIIILAISIIYMIIKFYSKNKIAGLLQIPYLLWTLFASYLNIAIYILNK